MITVKIKKLNPNAHLPKKEHETDAAFDLAIPEDYRLKYGRHVIKLGFAMEIPKGYCAKIRPRSGLASKGMEVIVHPTSRTAEPKRIDADIIEGLIDSSYRGEVGLIINSNCIKSGWLMAGSRLAQMTIEKVEPCVMELAYALNPGERGANGFGSTGITKTI